MTKTVVKHNLEKISDIANVFNIIEVIGGGSFGTVYRAIHQRTDETKALKIGSTFDVLNKTMLNQEIQILSSINHPNIVHLEAVYESRKKICLVLEYCPRELSKIIRNENFLCEADIQRIMQYLTSAIAYLHQRRIVHRDLKLENILLGENPDNPKDVWYVKLCDFSVSACKEGKGGDAMMNEFCGTPLYMAPEMGTKSYSEQCDIWALGVIMFLLFQGNFPYKIHNARQISEVITRTVIDFNTLKCSKAAAVLIQNCLEINPALRITAQEMQHSPWIQGKHVVDAKFTPNVLIMMDEYNIRARKSMEVSKSSRSVIISRHNLSFSARISVLGGLPENTLRSKKVEKNDNVYPKVLVSAVTKDH